MSDAVFTDFEDFDFEPYSADRKVKKEVVDKKVTFLKIIVFCLLFVVAMEFVLSKLILPCFTILQKRIDSLVWTLLGLRGIPFSERISITRFLVLSPTPGSLFKTKETVEADTPANLAISLLVIFAKMKSSYLQKLYFFSFN